MINSYAYKKMQTNNPLGFQLHETKVPKEWSEYFLPCLFGIPSNMKPKHSVLWGSFFFFENNYIEKEREKKQGI